MSSGSGGAPNGGITFNASNEAPGLRVAHVRVINSHPCQDLRDDRLCGLGANLRLKQEEPSPPVAFDHQRQAGQVRRKLGLVIPLAMPCVHKDRSWRGQTARLLNRLVGEQKAVFLSKKKGAQAVATGAVSRRGLLVSGMPILGGPHGSASFFGNPGWDANVSDSVHFASRRRIEQ